MASGEEIGDLKIHMDNVKESNQGKPVFFSSHNHSAGAKARPTGESLLAIPQTGFKRQKRCGAGKRMIMSFITPVVDITESEESAMEVDVLLLDERTLEEVGEKTLTFDTGTGYTSAGTVDLTHVANIPKRYSYEDAPDGLLFALNPRGRVRFFVGDDA